MTFRLRKPGFSLEVADNESGLMCDKEILKTSREIKMLDGRSVKVEERT